MSKGTGMNREIQNTNVPKSGKKVNVNCDELRSKTADDGSYEKISRAARMEQLLARRREMLLKIRETKHEIAVVRSDIRNLEKDCADKERELSKIGSNINEARQQRTVLKAFLTDVEKTADNVTEGCKKIDHQCNAIRKFRSDINNDNLYFVELSSDDSTEVPALESALMKSFRETCNSIRKLVLDSSVARSGKSMAYFNMKKKLLYREISEVVRNCTSTEAEIFLANLMNDTLNCLKRDIDSENADRLPQINPQNQHCRTSLISQELTKRKLNCLKRFAECLKLEAEIKEIRVEREKREKNFNAELTTSSCLNKSDVASVLRTKLELASAEAETKELQVANMDLERELDGFIQTQSQTRANFREIVVFKERLEEKQRIIRSLIVLNAKHRAQLDDKAEIITEFVRNHLIPSELNPQNVVAYPNFTVNETKLYLSLDVSKLKAASVNSNVVLISAFDRPNVQDMRFMHCRAPEWHLEMQRSGKIADRWFIKPLDEILGRCTDPRNATKEIDIEAVRTLTDRLNAASCISSDFETEINRVIARISKALKKCSNAKLLVQTWWHQPAKAISMRSQK